MLIKILLFCAVFAAPTEIAIVETFNRAHSIYEIFLADTMKNRIETEAYNENEFEPAVERMIVLLKAKKCDQCIPSYLKGLSYLEGSASELLTDQLKRIILEYPNELNAACKKTDSNVLDKLSIRFRDAITFLTMEKKGNKKSLRKKISSCLRTSSP